MHTRNPRLLFLTPERLLLQCLILWDRMSELQQLLLTTSALIHAITLRTTGKHCVHNAAPLPNPRFLSGCFSTCICTFFLPLFAITFSENDVGLCFFFWNKRKASTSDRDSKVETILISQKLELQVFWRRWVQTKPQSSVLFVFTFLGALQRYFSQTYIYIYISTCPDVHPTLKELTWNPKTKNSCDASTPGEPQPSLRRAPLSRTHWISPSFIQKPRKTGWWLFRFSCKIVVLVALQVHPLTPCTRQNLTC